MNHRPFEDWLLDNAALTPDQKRQLQTHLQTCSSCTAIAEVNLALKSVRLAEPAVLSERPRSGNVGVVLLRISEVRI